MTAGNVKVDCLKGSASYIGVNLGVGLRAVLFVWKFYSRFWALTRSPGGLMNYENDVVVVEVLMGNLHQVCGWSDLDNVQKRGDGNRLDLSQETIELMDGSREL